MSWIYSIVFAGLLFSSGSGAPDRDGLSAAVANPRAAVDSRDETEKFEQTYPLAANGRVSVSNVNGSILVEAWDRNEVRLEAVKTADTKESLAEVQIKVDARPDAFSVEADYGTWKRGDRNGNRRIEVQFRLVVPRTAVLNEIETVNGSVTVSNFTNFTKISAVNGNVTAANLTGVAELSTVNGEVAAEFEKLTETSRISLNTVNGPVNLVIPSDADATVRAESLNGEIKNDFGLPVRKGKYVGRNLNGRIGAGRVQVRLNSVNGPLTVGRRSDGKSLSPATNLLPQRSEDDDDVDDVGGMSPIEKQKMNRDVERAMRDAQKVSADALRSAQEEIRKIKPILDDLKVEVDTDTIETAVRDGLKVQKEAMKSLDTFRWQRSVPTIQKKSNSFPVIGVPKVVIDAKRCSIKVRGWDKPEVQYVLTRFSDRSDKADIDATEEVSASGVSIRVTDNQRPESADLQSGEYPDARIEVFVPRKSDLYITAAGEIRLEGVSGSVELKGGDEAIDIRGVEGTMKLYAGDGQVRVVGFRGSLDSATDGGDVYLEGVFSTLSAKASDGKITLTVPENSNLSLESNTQVEADGLALKRESDGLWQLGSGGTRYRFTFGDGGLVVRNASLLAGL